MEVKLNCMYLNGHGEIVSITGKVVSITSIGMDDEYGPYSFMDDNGYAYNAYGKRQFAVLIRDNTVLENVYDLVELYTE